MKRSAWLLGAMAIAAAASPASAQLTMQMSNGWTFSFAGNVNIFAQYQTTSASGNTGGAPLTLVPAGKLQGFYYGTGLLPAFATFSANGKEGNTDLGVHFGFAPQVQCGGGAHDCFGAQIDMRQVFLTIGGTWGTLTAGKELGVFQRQNILNDQTLFGVGGPVGSLIAPAIAPGGTTLGRIGWGYIYPNFIAQMTYTTPGGRPGSLSIGLMDPSTFGAYGVHNTPRVEAEGSWKSGNILVFASGTLQNSKTAASGPSTSKTAYGLAGGATWKSPTFSVHGSGYYGRGLGTTLMFTLGPTDANGLTKSYGFYGQATFTPTNSKATFAGSYGSSYLKASTGTGKVENTLISGGVYYQATKSLKTVFEGDYAWSKLSPTVAGQNKNKSFTGAFGFMLFY